ncbi:restriction endonuclease subunit S [Aeromonas hydrophila]
MANQMMQDKASEMAATQTVPTGYQQTEVGVIPEDWECKHIGELADVVRGGSPRPAGDARFFNGNFIPWLTVASLTNISLEQMYVVDTATKLTELGSLRSRVLDEDTLIISNSGATLGVAKILKIKCCANDGVAALVNQCLGNKVFLAHYINTQTKKLQEKIATGNGQPNLNTDLIRVIPVPFPREAEQAAIANVLSDTDALIAGLEQLIAKKQAIKSATMQQLLTGRTRLPQFALRPDGTPKGYKSSELGHIPEDWHEVSLSSVTKNIDAGVSVNSIDQLDAYGHGKHVLKTSCVNGGIFNCLEAKSIIPSDIGRAKCFPREGNIIVSRMNTPALVGEIGYIEKSLPGYFLPDRLWQVSFREDAELNTKWLMYVLAHPINAKKIKESATGTSNSMKNISKNAFLALKIYKPKIEEQTAIATILTDMDSELTALEQKLAKARDVKQGMMQQLLTGRIRLPLSKEA